MGWKDWAGSFRYALDGIVYCLRTQRNMKFHFAAAVAALGLAWYYALSSQEILLLILTISGVLAAEIINTALETVVNLISPDYHPLAKIAKDAAAGAVLIASLAAVAVGYFLFFHRLFG